MRWPAAVVLLGFALRAPRLGADGLWYDEAGSTFYASQPLGEIARNAIGDAHPPLYFYLQHFWIGLAGASEYAGRYSALLPSVATVAALYAVGRRLGGSRLGLAGAAVWALSPFGIAYAREVRMYGLMALMAVLATWLLLRLLERPGVGTAAAYAASLVGLFYLHYFGVLLLGGHALLAARRGFVPWAASAAVAVGLFAPWLWAVRDQLGGYVGGERSTAGLGRIVWSTLAAFASGFTPERLDERRVDDPAMSLLLPLAGLVLAAVGAVRAPAAALWVAGTIGAAVLLVAGRADFTARYLTAAAPAYALAVGAGLLATWRWRPRAGAAATAVTVALTTYALWHQYADSRLWHEDFRAAVRHLAAAERPGQAVVLNAAYMRPVYAYYADPEWPTVGVSRGDPDVEARIAEVAARHPFVWLVLWQEYFSDPGGQARGWLERNADRVDERVFRGDVRVIGYATRRGRG